MCILLFVPYNIRQPGGRCRCIRLDNNRKCNGRPKWNGLRKVHYPARRLLESRVDERHGCDHGRSWTLKCDVAQRVRRERGRHGQEAPRLDMLEVERLAPGSASARQHDGRANCGSCCAGRNEYCGFALRVPKRHARRARCSKRQARRGE